MLRKKKLTNHARTSSNRIFALLLAVILVFSSVPSSISYAAEEGFTSPDVNIEETTPSDENDSSDNTSDPVDITDTDSNVNKETQDTDTEPSDGTESAEDAVSTDNTDSLEEVAPLEEVSSDIEDFDSTLPNTSLSLTWDDVAEGDKTVLPLMDWNTRYKATFSVAFPTDATNKKIVVEPTTAAIQFANSGSSDTILAEAATVSKTKAGSYSNEFNTSLSNSVWTYTMKDTATAFKTTLEFANSGINTLFSSPAKADGAENTLPDCIKATLSYTDGSGSEQSTETFLSVKEINSVKAIATNSDLNRDYYSTDEPRLVKAGETYTTGENTYLAGIHFVKESDGSQFKVQIPIQKILITMNFTKGLEISNTSVYTEVEGSRKDLGNGLYQAQFLYNGKENYYSNASYGQSYFNFLPQVKIPDNAAQNSTYKISVEQVDVYMYKEWDVDEDNKATGNPTLYSFTRDNGTDFGTAYYKVNSLGTPWVNGYVTNEDHSGLTMNARDINYTNVNWYNENYKEAVGMVGRFLYGCFGTTPAENQIVDLKFDSTAVGVRALRVPVPNTQYESVVNAKGSFSIQIATTKNNTLASKTVTANAIAKNSNSGWGCLYLDSKALGLAEDEYVTELRYKLDTIPAYWSKNAQTGNGGCDWTYAYVFGRILDPTKESYKHTIQLFNGTEADVSASPAVLSDNSTDVGYINGAITGTGRVDLAFTGSDVDGSHHYGVAVTAVNGKNRYSISGYAHNVPIDAGDTVSIATTLYALDKGTNSAANTLSDLMGYTPITEIYIRDVFGEGISNLNITKNYYSQDESGSLVDVSIPLVKNGQPAERGVTITLDHTEKVADSHGFYNNVYKVTFDSKAMNSKWDNVIGAWTDLGYNSKAGANTQLQNAKMEISYDIKVPDDFGTDVDTTTGLSKRMGEEISLNESIWVKAESGTTTNKNGITFQYHDQYSNAFHGDPYDVDGDGFTVYKTTEDGNASYNLNNDTITVQGDYDIQRTVYAHNLTLTQPKLRTDVAFDNDIKESDKADRFYRTYDAKDKVTSTVNIAEDDGTLRLLVANFSSTKITDLAFYVPIPKKGEKWGDHNAEAFPFSVKLTGELQNADSSVFTITYGTITPATTDDAFENQANKFETYNAAHAADYNCIRIVANELPMGETGETNLDQYKRTKYFTAPIAYADTEKSNELLYDVWSGAAHYTSTAGVSQATNWYATETLGIRARQLKAEAEVTNGTYKLSSTTPKSGNEFTATITANDHYDLPDSKADIEVTIGDTQYNDFTYNTETGVVTIPGTAVTDNIKVVAKCTPKNFTATNTVTDGSADGGKTAEYGTPYTSTITPVDVNHLLPISKDKVTVTIDGKQVDTFTYDPETGKVTIDGSYVVGNIEIVAICPSKRVNVDETVDKGGTSTEDEPLYGKDYTTTIIPNKGYRLPKTADDITVTIDGVEYKGFTYDPETGKVFIPGEAVTGDIKIEAACTKKYTSVRTYPDDSTVSSNTAAAAATTAAPVSTVKGAQTGDTANINLWISLIAIALLGISCFGYMTYKKRKEQQ